MHFLCLSCGFNDGKEGEGSVLTEAVKEIRNIYCTFVTIIWQKSHFILLYFSSFMHFCIENRLVPKNLFLEAFVLSQISVVMLLQRFIPLQIPLCTLNPLSPLRLVVVEILAKGWGRDILDIFKTQVLKGRYNFPSPKEVLKFEPNIVIHIFPSSVCFIFNSVTS